VFKLNTERIPTVVNTSAIGVVVERRTWALRAPICVTSSIDQPHLLAARQRRLELR